MPRGRSNKSRRVDYVADFETTTKPDPLTGHVRVWGWGIARVDAPNQVLLRHTLEEFIEYIQQGNAVVYFHNLRFDGNFILYWLMTNGYVHTVDNRSTQNGEFTTLISDMGRWYNMKVRWNNGNTVEFRDSLNKLPMSLARVAESFKLPESKGEIDYHKDRPVGYIMDDEERDYLRRDVSIIANAIKLTLDEGMEKLTVASDSLAEFKHLFGQKNFARMFPVLPMGMDAEIRKAYRGGFTYADPRFSQKRTRSGLVLDVNSLYPYIMYTTLLPYDEPQWRPGKVVTTERYPLAIFSVTFTAKLKPNHIPCIQVKGSSLFMGTEYQVEISEPTTLVVSNVDWDLWNEHYDIDVVSYDGGWVFHGVHGVFDAYIDKWSKVKAESTGGRREIAKLHLNSLYGKFATNPNVTSKVPELKNDTVGFHRGEDETRAPVYTAMGVFITSYARALTIRAAQANYDCFAYADTDSLHLLTDDVPTDIEVHPTRLGAWKLEYHFQEALYVRPKAYMELIEYGAPPLKNVYVNRVAGLPERVSERLEFHHMYDRAVFDGKLRPKNVPGGQLLEDVPYQMRY
jgi:hypothetical protein